VLPELLSFKDREKHSVYQTDTFGIPARYEVFRNDKSEKSGEISYVIE